jgi:hypothetical protein
MNHTREEGAQTLAERWCWHAARREDARMARRLDRKQVVDGVCRLDEGALLDDVFPCLRELGVVDWLGDVQGTAIQRMMGPCVQDAWRYGLKTLYGVERMHALPPLLCSAEALMRWVGFNAHQVRQGVCPRGAARRQGPRREAPLCPDTLAENIVKVHRRDGEALVNRVIRALAQTGSWPPRSRGWSTPPLWRRRRRLKAAVR